MGIDFSSTTFSFERAMLTHGPKEYALIANAPGHIYCSDEVFLQDLYPACVPTYTEGR